MTERIVVTGYEARYNSGSNVLLLPMVILGLDPGIARTGFGLIAPRAAQPLIRCGCLTTSPTQAVEDRLFTIGQDLTALLAAHHPNLAVIEEIFFGTNTSTAMVTAHTRGVLLYILRQHHIPIYNLTPLQIKSRLTGYGAASKQQVQAVVTQRLHLLAPPQPDDAADALAAALCVAEESMALRV